MVQCCLNAISLRLWETQCMHSFGFFLPSSLSLQSLKSLFDCFKEPHYSQILILLLRLIRCWWFFWFLLNGHWQPHFAHSPGNVKVENSSQSRRLLLLRLLVQRVYLILRYHLELVLFYVEYDIVVHLQLVLQKLDTSLQLLESVLSLLRYRKFLFWSLSLFLFPLPELLFNPCPSLFEPFHDSPCPLLIHFARHVSMVPMKYRVL